MEDITCKVCYVVFDEKTFAPKVLECGHTLCLSCVSLLLKNSSSCPKCRREMGKKRSASEYPTNYDLLSLSTSYKKHCSLKDQFNLRHARLMSKYLHAKEKLQEKIEGNKTHLAFLESGLIKLQGLENKEQYVETSLQTLLELQQQFNKSENNAISSASCEVCVTLNLDSFDSQSAFLYEIYNRKINGEQIFAAHRVVNKIKYGKVSVQDNLIFIHALTVAEVDVNACTVLFEDLKKCLKPKLNNFEAFLKISCNDKGLQWMVKIKLEPVPEAQNFVKLCTGEGGAVYKGSNYDKGQDSENFVSLLRVAEYVVHDDDGEDLTGDYPIQSSIGIKCDYEDVVVSFSMNRTLEIQRYILNSCFSSVSETIRDRNIVGKIAKSFDFNQILSYKNKYEKKIQDSGVVILFQ